MGVVNVAVGASFVVVRRAPARAAAPARSEALATRATRPRGVRRDRAAVRLRVDGDPDRLEPHGGAGLRLLAVHLLARRRAVRLVHLAREPRGIAAAAHPGALARRGTSALLLLLVRGAARRDGHRALRGPRAAARRSAGARSRSTRSGPPRWRCCCSRSGRAWCSRAPRCRCSSTRRSGATATSAAWRAGSMRGTRWARSPARSSAGICCSSGSTSTAVHRRRAGCARAGLRDRRGARAAAGARGGARARRRARARARAARLGPARALGRAVPRARAARRARATRRARCSTGSTPTARCSSTTTIRSPASPCTSSRSRASASARSSRTASPTARRSGDYPPWRWPACCPRCWCRGSSAPS